MQFRSKAIEEHGEVPLADGGRLETLVTERQEREGDTPPTGPSACYVLCTQRGSEPVSPARVDEITSLVRTQGGAVVGVETARLDRPDPRTLIRRGVAERIAEHARERGANLLVIDAELSPSQARNLEDATGLRVTDREAVILNVFERHATSRRARVQVEIAHLEYLRPRIRGVGLDMDQQAGGVLGSRGPGETASELMARRIDGRLADLRRELVRLERSGVQERRRRERCARVVLVGYTNAGKTSLMNALTQAGLSARDRPFETLDTTARSLSRHGGDVLLSDTVGFIRRLPERLIASFESTLAEVREASLLLVVLDAASPEIEAHRAETEAVLTRLRAEATPRVVVFNKTDLWSEPPSPGVLSRLAGGHRYVRVSSRDPESVRELRAIVLGAARAHHRVREIFVPYAAAETLGSIYASCRVLRSIATPSGTQLVIEGEPHVVERIARASRGSR